MAVRESAHAKGLRLLDERRVRLVERLPHGGARFTVVGDSQDHQVSRYKDERGRIVDECSCPNAGFHPVRPTCAHMEAVRIWMAVLGWPMRVTT